MTNVFCYLDATGSIVSRISDSDKPVYYYALVLHGSTKPKSKNEKNTMSKTNEKRTEYGPIPVVELLSDTHDVP